MAYDLDSLARQTRNLIVNERSITLTEVSRRLGVDRHTLEKAVVTVAGMNFRHFRHRLLFDEAVAMLRAEPNLSVKEVAFKFGFSSQRSFGRFVKSISGTPPTELRKSC